MRHATSNVCRRYLCIAMALLVVNAWGQAGERTPHIGYLYPAGGQQGSTVEILVGGQFLNGARQIYVTGAGVHGAVTAYVRPVNNKQLQAIGRRLREIRDERMAALPAPMRDRIAAGKDEPKIPKDAAGKANEETVPLPNHPMLRNLEDKSPQELRQIADYFFNKKRQQNAQIGELAVVSVTIESGAAPGVREIRLGTAGGLTNPMSFHVGSLPESLEHEPNDPPAAATHSMTDVFEPPLLLNGQILPGDVDRFWFRARQGQHLVIEAHARRLSPYLADAVPGWFQGVLTLYDADGTEVAFSDDYCVDPDPVILYRVPEDGAYAVEVRDALYRGREDFVYRVIIGEQPFITEVFPVGGRLGEETRAAVTGWNLPTRELALDTRAGGADLRQARIAGNDAASNDVIYAVDGLDEGMEVEPNDSQAEAQPVLRESILNGRIDRAGDADFFCVEGHAGDEVVADVSARRLGSPMDSIVQLLDASGRVVAWNDDREEMNTGLVTHHADSYVRAEFPEDGTYYVKVRDAQRHGGDGYVYRLRIGPPRPDFELYVTPSSVNVRAGRSAAITVHALRKDGYDGAIEVALADPAGFTLQGERIPAGRDSIRMTVTAPRKAPAEPVVLRLVGSALIDGQPVSKPAVPAEDMTQAFAYHHLVPSQQLLAAVQDARRPGPPVQMDVDGPLRIPAGGSAEVLVRTPVGRALEQVRLELSDPPKGVRLDKMSIVPEGVALEFATDGDAPAPGFTDNLIVAIHMEVDNPQQRGAGANKNRRVSAGVLPAIPIEVVAP